MPKPLGHYIENTGTTTMRYLEMFSGRVYSDVSLNQWMALAPPGLIKEHLKLSDATISLLHKTKAIVVGSGAKGGSPT